LTAAARTLKLKASPTPGLTILPPGQSWWREWFDPPFAAEYSLPMSTSLPRLCVRGLTWLLLLGPVLWLRPAAAGAEELTGEQIYRQRCAACHGASGEGSDDYKRALAGDRSVAQLAGLIAKTMPKDDPGTCTGADAQKVAAFIYDAFYSPAARERNKPPRIELSRLTVRQYRNAVADLVGSFRSPGKWDEQRGLHGEYFKSRRFRREDRVLDRTDAAVAFDFGETGPDPKKFDANEFSIRWEGSVLAPETGDYEFIVRTDHATRLWVNDARRPLIDAWVKSGSDTEYRGSLFLLGGRAYPLRLEFSKAKQGVDDSKTNKRPATKASITLEWKPPHRAAEVIPQRNLTPNRFPVLLVAATPFPADDRSLGYERGTTISRAWEEATTEAAIEIAGYVAANLRELSGVADDASDRKARVHDFCLRFAERAFRRPLTDEQKKRYVDHQFEAGLDLDTAVKRVLLFVLKSPRFLYREIDAPLTLPSPPGGEGRVRGDGYDVAARLSFGLWDSLPDQELLDAAARGQLATREQVVRQAERMVSDLRARSKVREFLLQWLKVDQAPELSKDPRQFPGFDQALASDLRTSLELFLDDVVWSDASDFRQLLLADTLYLNGRLARFYGADLPADAPFQKVALQPGERAGVLTHPYLMATFAYTGASSPIHRGVFLARSVLGLTLRPPPEAAAPLAPDLHPQLTTRERVLLQTKPQACQTCHGMINPLGFPMEHFDAVGRFREQEKERPIDATGFYQTRAGKVEKFAGVRELAAFLAGSEETHEAFAEQLFHYLVKQPVRAYGPRKLAELRRSFADNGYNVRKLVVTSVAESALFTREEKRKGQP
jgi:mono/diheme cytochrome c family protein